MNYFAGSAKVVAALAVLLIVLEISACSSSKPKPVDFHINGEADTLLNRDVSARPLSVVLDVYQLKDRQAFSRLTFEDFVSGKSEMDLFGDELIQKTEVVILPGGKQSLATSLMPETKYLGVVAIYRMPSEQQWRYLAPAEQIRETSFWHWGADEKKTITVHLHDCYLTVEGVNVDLIPGQKAEAVPACAIPANSSTPIDAPTPASVPNPADVLKPEKTKPEKTPSPAFRT